MLNQNVFMETLREVKEIVRTAAEPLTKEDMLGYFSEMDLNEEQKNMVINYLLAPEEESVSAPEKPEEEAEEATFEDVEASKVFRMFMEEVEGLKTYKPEELSMMYVKLLQGDKAVITLISEAWMKRVVEIARKENANRFGLEDIIQEGNMGLFLKLTELCGSKAAINVEEELLEAVKASMKAYISEIAGEDDNEQAVVGKVNLINEAIKFLQGPNGERPSMKAMADYTGLDEEELQEILDIIEKADKK